MERKREQESYDDAQNLKNSSAFALSLLLSPSVHKILAIKFFFHQSAHKKAST
jgi:hypothetical protein